LPPLAVATAVQSSSLAVPPVATRTIVLVASALNNPGRTTIAASACNASSGTWVNAGSCVRSAVSSTRSSPSSLRAR
jgi:hypothetical protein